MNGGGRSHGIEAGATDADGLPAQPRLDRVTERIFRPAA
jgi:hypothetical protein